MGIKKAVAVVVGLGIVFAASGCGRSDADVHREAILRVLRADKELSAKMRTAQDAATSLAEGAALIDKYCEEMDRVDMSECPADFRLAFRQHLRSWRTSAAKVREMPDGFWDGVVMGAFNSLSGELDGGMGRLSKELQAAGKEIDETYKEAEHVAAQYGAVL